MCDADSDVEFVNNIAPNVIAVLEKEHFFERLDDQFCPADPSGEPTRCGHSFEISVGILRELGMDSDDVEDVLAVLSSRGACCDCEVLYNVAEESQFKSQYWKARALNLGKSNPHSDVEEN
jgi:hypothetical protein